MFSSPSFLKGGVAVASAPLTLTVSNQTGAYSVVAGDNGSVIRITSGTGPITLPSCAAVGVGFNVCVLNESFNNTIVVNKVGSDTIQGRTFNNVGFGQLIRLFVVDASTSGLWRSISTSVQSNFNGGNITIGDTALAGGTNSIAIGQSAVSTTSSTAISGNAGSTSSTAIGQNSAGQLATTATGAGAMALGGSYASGTDSFAAAIATNSSSYGAQGANSIAIGKQATAGGSGGVAISLFGQAAWGAQANSNSACAIGDGAIAGSVGAFAFGLWPIATPQGKYAFASGRFAVVGDAQLGAIVLRNQTTNATATVLTSTQAAANTLDQLILPNDSSYTFTGSMIARNTGSDTDSKAWTFFGAIRRGVAAANTALIGTPGINVVGSDGSAWSFTLTADTTNGGLAVTVTGEAAKTINWVCRIDTVEVTG